jgi:hypothetical protein
MAGQQVAGDALRSAVVGEATREASDGAVADLLFRALDHGDLLIGAVPTPPQLC